MQETHNRAFKGVWISKDIWLAKDLGWTEKLLLVEIDSLDGENGCFASNEYLANFFSLSKDRISRMVSSLKKKGYISVEMQYKDGTKEIEKRIIRLVKNPIGENANTYRQKHQDAIGENSNTPIGENAKDNNTFINNTDYIDDDINIDPLRFFQENVRFSLSPIEIQTIAYWEKDYPKDLIIEAIKRTALANANTTKYTERILIDWQKKRITTLAEVARADAAFEQKKGGQQNASNRGSNKTNNGYKVDLGF